MKFPILVLQVQQTAWNLFQFLLYSRFGLTRRCTYAHITNKHKHTHTQRSTHPSSTSGLQSEPCEVLLPSSHPRSHKAFFIRTGGGELESWRKKKAPTLTPKGPKTLGVCLRVHLHLALLIPDVATGVCCLPMETLKGTTRQLRPRWRSNSLVKLQHYRPLKEWRGWRVCMAIAGVKLWISLTEKIKESNVWNRFQLN